MNEIPAVMTIQELAKVLRVNQSTAYEIVKSGGLKSFRLGKPIRILREDLEEWMHSRREQLAATR